MLCTVAQRFQCYLPLRPRPGCTLVTPLRPDRRSQYSSKSRRDDEVHPMGVYGTDVKLIPRASLCHSYQQADALPSRATEPKRSHLALTKPQRSHLALPSRSAPISRLPNRSDPVSRLPYRSAPVTRYRAEAIPSRAYRTEAIPSQRSYLP